MGANLEQSMHKSKLGGFIIDCDTDDLEAATRFWSRALGMPVHELPGNENAAYRGLTDAQHGLDIETDDIDAEVRRLEAIGAKKVQQVHSWWVMEAPTGQRFCVVKAKQGDFERRANTWQ